MCKIFAMTNMANVKVTEGFIGVVRDAVCRTYDRDGFGYAVNTLDGELWGERTTDPFKFDALTHKVMGMANSLPIVSSQNSFGKVGAENNLAFIGHGRMSTNDVNIQNTHPFVNDNVALIHNGVVSDPYGVVKGLTTSCDTEILLKLWETDEIDGIQENAAGYYAVALLDKKGQLHVIRDARASLFIAYSKTIDSYLIATTVDIINEVAKNMKWEIDTAQSIMDNMYAVFRGNEVVHHEEIYPLGYVTGIDDSKAKAALGAYEYLSGDLVDCVDSGTEDNEDSEEYLYDDEVYSELSCDDAPVLDDEITYADVVDLMDRRKVS